MSPPLDGDTVFVCAVSGPAVPFTGIITPGLLAQGSVFHYDAVHDVVGVVYFDVERCFPNATAEELSFPPYFVVIVFFERVPLFYL